MRFEAIMQELDSYKKEFGEKSLSLNDCFVVSPIHEEQNSMKTPLLSSIRERSEHTSEKKEIYMTEVKKELDY